MNLNTQVTNYKIGGITVFDETNDRAIVQSVVINHFRAKTLKDK